MRISVVLVINFDFAIYRLVEERRWRQQMEERAVAAIKKIKETLQMIRGTGDEKMRTFNLT